MISILLFSVFVNRIFRLFPKINDFVTFSDFLPLIFLSVSGILYMES
jgi:hypothetical protein